MRYLFLFLIILVVYGCKENKAGTATTNKISNIDEFQFVKDSTFVIGDVRRYGLFPDKAVDVNVLKSILNLAHQGLPINFPPGYFKTSITLEGAHNIELNFEDVVLGGSLQIINKDTIASEQIKISGTLTILDKLFIRKSNKISFDTLKVETDTLKNIYKEKNRGVSIYQGSKNIKFSKLQIKNTGGNQKDFYKYSAAALQIHGWNNNPENIIINDLEVINAARTSVYITGNNHRIDKMLISNYGFGASANMFGLEDAKPGEEKEFTGLWINKCNNCVFNNVIINTNNAKGKYSLKLDEGEASKPTFINALKLIESTNQLPILDDKLTNILVKKVVRE